MHHQLAMHAPTSWRTTTHPLAPFSLQHLCSWRFPAAPTHKPNCCPAAALKSRPALTPARLCTHTFFSFLAGFAFLAGPPSSSSPSEAVSSSSDSSFRALLFAAFEPPPACEGCCQIGPSGVQQFMQGRGKSIVDEQQAHDLVLALLVALLVLSVRNCPPGCCASRTHTWTANNVCLLTCTRVQQCTQAHVGA